MWWPLENTLVAVVLALAIWPACRFARMSPAVQHALWLVVLIKIIAPPLYDLQLAPAISQFVPALHDNIGSQREDTNATADEMIGRGELPTRLDSGEIEALDTTMIGTVELETVDIVQQPAAELQQQAAHSPWSEPNGLLVHDSPNVVEARSDRRALFLTASAWLIAIVWAAGGMLVGVRQVLRILAFRARVRCSEAAPAWFDAEVQALADRLGMRAPPVRIVADIASPAIWSLGQPVLLWPAVLLSPAALGCRQGVIVHELAHLRRRDHWVRWLELVVACLWWWNPLFWFVRSQLHATAELACDAWVVSLLPNRRRSYAKTLVDVCELHSVARLGVPALGISSDARRTFERRLTMILRDRVSCRMPTAAAVLVCGLGLLALPGWSLAQDAADPAAPAAEATSQLASPIDPAAGAPVNVPDGGTVLLGGQATPSSDAAAVPGGQTTATVISEGTDLAPATTQRLPAAVPPSPYNVPSQLNQPFGGPPTSSAKVTQRRAPANSVDVVGSMERAIEELAQAAAKASRSGDRQQLDAIHNRLNAIQNDLGLLNSKGPNRTLTYTIAPRVDFVNNLGDDVEVQTLARATFKLPGPAAEATGSYLKTVAPDLEVRVNADSLTITTTQEELVTLSRFIALVREHAKKQPQREATEELSRPTETLPPSTAPAPTLQVR